MERMSAVVAAEAAEGSSVEDHSYRRHDMDAEAGWSAVCGVTEPRLAAWEAVQGIIFLIIF